MGKVKKIMKDCDERKEDNDKDCVTKGKEIMGHYGKERRH